MAHSGADSMNVRQIFFTNLQLLGFDPGAMESVYSIPFNRDMFNLPNKKGYEVVIHFLFKQLNPSLCQEQFRDCWPITNKKSEQLFNKTVNRWLTNISKEEVEAHLPRIVPSLFLAPGGDKFNRLLFYFSTYVVLRCIKQTHGVKEHEMLRHPVLTQHTLHMGDSMAKALQSATARHRKRFLETAKESRIAQREWTEFSSQLVKENRRRTKNIRELERQTREEVQRSAERGLLRGNPVPPRRKSPVHDYDAKMLAIKRAQSVQQVRGMWGQVDAFSKDRSQEKEVIESILQTVVDRYQIDVAEVNVKVPDLLLRECEQEIQRRQVDNTYEGGKVNLLSLVQLWNLSLHLYIEKLHEAGVPKFELADISTQVHTHHAQLANARTLRGQLSMDLLPELRKSIAKVKSILVERMRQKHLSPDSDTDTPLNLVDPSPPVSFTPDADQKDTPPFHILSTTFDQDEGTPKAAEGISETIAKTSRRVQLFQGSPVYAPTLARHGQPAGDNKLPQQSRLPTRRPADSVPAPHRRVASCSAHGRPQNGATNGMVGKIAKRGTAPDPGFERRTHHLPEAVSDTTPPKSESLASPRLKENANHQDEFREEVMMKTPSLKHGHYAGNKIPAKKTPSHSVEDDLCRTPAKAATPRAHDILADKIVAAVIGDVPVTERFLGGSTECTPFRSTPDFNLVNPRIALGQEAFVSREQIVRSPINSDEVSEGYVVTPSRASQSVVQHRGPHAVTSRLDDGHMIETGPTRLNEQWQAHAAGGEEDARSDSGPSSQASSQGHHRPDEEDEGILDIPMTYSDDLYEGLGAGLVDTGMGATSELMYTSSGIRSDTGDNGTPLQSPSAGSPPLRQSPPTNSIMNVPHMDSPREPDLFVHRTDSKEINRDGFDNGFADRSTRKPLDSSALEALLRIESEEVAVGVGDHQENLNADVDVDLTIVPTVSITTKIEEMFETATPKLISRTSATYRTNVHGRENAEGLPTDSDTAEEEGILDLGFPSPVDLRQVSLDEEMLGGLASPLFNQTIMENPFTTTTTTPLLDLSANVKGGKKYMVMVSPDVGQSPFMMPFRGPSGHIRDSDDNENGGTLDKSASSSASSSTGSSHKRITAVDIWQTRENGRDMRETLPGAEARPKAEPAGEGDDENYSELHTLGDDSFAPLEHGLNYSSPFKSTTNNPNAATETDRKNDIDDIIANYRKLRMSAMQSLSNVQQDDADARMVQVGQLIDLQVGGDENGSTDESSASPTLTPRDVVRSPGRDLFSLDVEDLDLDEHVTAEVFIAGTDADMQTNGGTLLDSFLADEGSLLVPASPPSPN